MTPKEMVSLGKELCQQRERSYKQKQRKGEERGLVWHCFGHLVLQRVMRNTAGYWSHHISFHF